MLPRRILERKRILREHLWKRIFSISRRILRKNYLFRQSDSLENSLISDFKSVSHTISEILTFSNEEDRFVGTPIKENPAL